LQQTGKISLKLDSKSSLLLEYGRIRPLRKVYQLYKPQAEIRKNDNSLSYKFKDFK